jgi:hypothetical protein
MIERRGVVRSRHMWGSWAERRRTQERRTQDTATDNTLMEEVGCNVLWMLDSRFTLQYMAQRKTMLAYYYVLRIGRKDELFVAPTTVDHNQGTDISQHCQTQNIKPEYVKTIPQDSQFWWQHPSSDCSICWITGTCPHSCYSPFQSNQLTAEYCSY